jgi:hypothetical protein
MRVETPQFIVTGCKWNLSTDKTIAAPLTAAVRSGIESIALICKTCNSSWVAHQGDGAGPFTSTVGAIRIQCLLGETEGTIALASLM